MKGFTTHEEWDDLDSDGVAVNECKLRLADLQMESSIRYTQLQEDLKRCSSINMIIKYIKTTFLNQNLQ